MSEPIYLLRHGETEWNRAALMQGAKDSPLTDLGLTQAHAVGRALRAEIGKGAAFQMIISPLGRCQKTAEIVIQEIGFDKARCHVDPEVREISWGDWDGLSFAEIERRYPGALEKRELRIFDFVPPNGESYAQMTERAGLWLATALANPMPLIVVSHGAIGRTLRGLYLGLDFDAARAQEQPQDAFYKLIGGQVVRIDAAVREIA